MTRRKGQIFTTDFMASIVVLGFIITLFMTLWSLGIMMADDTDRVDLIENQGQRTTTILAQTTGFPENWHQTEETRIPGFANADGTLNIDKIQHFEQKSYEEQTEKLRTSNFQLEFTMIDENAEIEDISIGQEPSEDSRLVIPYDRNVVIQENGELAEAQMRYMVWE